MREGDVLWGKYRVKERIGRGGMSRVYLAERIEDRVLFALKQGDTVEERNALLREYECLKRLAHGGIPKVKELLDHSEGYVMVMEYVEGEDLKRYLERKGCFSPEQVRIWGISLCCILIYLHSQTPPVWHLDVKPSNVMVRKAGGLVLMDFGAAVRSGEVPGRTLGTKGYAAPEQRGGGAISAASDIYSLGATLYHLWTGRIYEGERLEEDSFLGGVLGRCLAERPGKRYRSGEELLRDLLDGTAGSRRRSLASVLKVSVVGTCCLVVWSAFALLNFQRNAQEEQMQREWREISDSENLCMFFPDKRDGYCLYLAEAALDGVLESGEEAGFWALCESVPRGEEESGLALLRSDPGEYEAVARLAVEMGMLYGSWEFAEAFVWEGEWSLEQEMIRCRRELLAGDSEDFSGYWELLVRWKEKEPKAGLRVLREMGLFFAGFREAGLEEEIRRFWEAEREFSATAEWSLLEELLEGTSRKGVEDEGIVTVE